MLKFKQSPTSQSADFTPKPATARRRCSFVSSQTGFSKANVLLKNVSIPLAWPADEYFGNKKEWREFTVQLILRTSQGKEVFSQPKEAVNRTYTDVDFHDIFFFGDQSPEFCVEAMLYCKRTDENANMMHTLSRSLGRSLSHSLKRYINSAGNSSVSGGASNVFCEGTSSSILAKDNHTNDALNHAFIENYRNPDKMCALGVARFRLRNASLAGRTHTYNLELVPQGTYPGVTRSQLLPLYGNICAQLLVQPTSLISPLAQGQLDIFFVEGGILLQKMDCVLQGSFLKCYDENDGGGPPSLTLPINQDSSIEVTAFQTALRLRLRDASSSLTRHFLCITESHSAYLGWKNALHNQILDCVKWADFASLQKNPHALSKDLPIIQPAYSPSQTTAERPSDLHKTVSAKPLRSPGQQPAPSAYGTSSRTCHYQKSPAVQRRQRRPIPTPDYFQTAELSTTFPTEEEEQPVKQVPPNTYVISLQIGTENGQKGAISTYSHAKHASSDKHSSNASNSVTFAEQTDQEGNTEKQLLQESSSRAVLLPRARLHSTAANNRWQQKRTGTTATVSRAETWNYANSSTQFTRL